MARHGRLRHGLCHGRARRRLRRGACLLAGGLSRPHDGHQRAGRAGHDAVGPERAVLRQHARGQQLARSSVHQSRVAGPGLGAGHDDPHVVSRALPVPFRLLLPPILVPGPSLRLWPPWHSPGLLVCDLLQARPPSAPHLSAARHGRPRGAFAAVRVRGGARRGRGREDSLNLNGPGHQLVQVASASTQLELLQEQAATPGPVGSRTRARLCH
mmetsp:Transcript_1896/g.4264  ORF Transcript_1896/g.4264 Transcript_1896/m.4264 type:complete len:213 (-) Transcript_1896:370-1008(-)